MVNIRNAFLFASVALVAVVSASEKNAVHRTLQAVNFRLELLNAINAARKAEGLQDLCLNKPLMISAQNQANDMAENNFVKSTGSDGSTPQQRAAKEGFEADTVTEIVGAGYRTASTIVEAWVKAASAKDTVLSKHTVMGPGYTFDKTRKFVHYWAVDFSDGVCDDGNTTTVVELPDDKPETPPSEGAPAPPSGSGAGNLSDAGDLETPEAPPGGNLESTNETPETPPSEGAPAPPSGSGAGNPPSDPETPPADTTPAPADGSTPAPADGSTPAPQ